MSADSDKLVAYLREIADEIEKAHALLDDLQVPDGPVPGSGIDGTLAARIALLADRSDEVHFNFPPP